MQNHTILSFFTMKSRQNSLHTAKSCQKSGTERGAGDTMKMEKKFKFFVPGIVGYMQFYGEDERAAREAARSWLAVKRLPSNTFVEPYDHKSAEFIRKSNEQLVKGTGLCTTDLY